MALGMAIFWVSWLREDHDESWLPEGYVDHEFPFVFTDSIVAVLLVVAALLPQVSIRPAYVYPSPETAVPQSAQFGRIDTWR